MFTVLVELDERKHLASLSPFVDQMNADACGTSNA